MIVIPAIDLINNKVVRLTQGDYSQKSSYSENPFDLVQKFFDAGANRIHIIDLEGAKKGKASQLGFIGDIANSVDAKIQVGGGIRDTKVIDEYLALGLDRVILGTKACLDDGFLKEALQAFSENIIIGIDAKDGYVATHGWTNITDIPAKTLLQRVVELSGKEIIYTDIAKDGMLQGPNYEQIKSVASLSSIDVIASGGVGDISHIDAFKKLSCPNLIGVIVGKALYEGKIDLKDAISVCSQNV